jgi:hypothetical protein
LTRSITAAIRNSSSSVPPSRFVIVFRWNPVATRCASVALGSRSPASCSTVKRSKGRSSLKALITQSRYRHISRSPSDSYPLESA